MAVVQVRRGPDAGSLKPEYVEDVSAELTRHLEGVRCPVHDTEPTIVATIRGNGMVDIELRACCTQLQGTVDRRLGRYLR